MDFKKGILLPAAAFAEVILAVACNSSPVTPAPSPTATATIAAAPTATSTATPIAPAAPPTLEARVLGIPQCSTSSRDEVSYVLPDGKVLWSKSIAEGIESYSFNATGGRGLLTKATFVCETAFVDLAYNQVIAVGRDDKYFPAKISFRNLDTGVEEAYFWHAGHLKSVLPLYGDTLVFASGSISQVRKDFIVFTGAGNDSELIARAETKTGKPVAYVPVIGVLQRVDGTVRPVAYAPVVLAGGQAFDLAVSYSSNSSSSLNVRLEFTLQTASPVNERVETTIDELMNLPAGAPLIVR